MGSFQEDASFQASHVSFQGEARAADYREEQDSRSHASVDELNAAGAGPIGRRSRVSSSVTDTSSNASINYQRAPRQDKIGSESFWCGAFCMHLPGLWRRRPMQQQQSMSLSEPGGTRASAVSKAASMERFKYSSSSSGAAFERVEEVEEEQEASAYFDLPLELLRSSSVDMETPVTAAFVFDGSRGWGLRKSVQPEVPDLEFSFPAPPAFSSP